MTATELPRILVVDDEEDVLLLCSVNLEAEGYEVLEASNGADALALLDGVRPDLIFLDIMMPIMDGWRCLSALKADQRLSSIPVVMLTAKVNADDHLRGLSGGADDYVTKPFHPTALIDTVPRVLNASVEERDRRRRDMIRRLEVLERI